MKARESFFFGMIPVLFPILSDRCRNSVVFFNHCFTDTHLTFSRGVFYLRPQDLTRKFRVKPEKEEVHFMEAHFHLT